MAKKSSKPQPLSTPPKPPRPDHIPPLNHWVWDIQQVLPCYAELMAATPEQKLKENYDSAKEHN